MARKRVIITGANAGIGKAAAIQLAQAGFHVVLACRNRERGEKALADVLASGQDLSAELMLVDMSSQRSVRDLAQIYRAQNDALDVLIHNAAQFDISARRRSFTPEGIESIWATNHLGPVLLTEELLSCLKRSGRARVIVISSKGLLAYPFIKVNLEDPEFKRRRFSVPKAYYQSKLAQEMYTQYLGESLRRDNIFSNAIRVTNVKIDLNRYPNVSPLARAAYSLKSKFSITPERMARTYVYLAASREVDGVSGKIFDEKNRVLRIDHTKKREDVDRLMQVTRRYLEIGS